VRWGLSPSRNTDYNREVFLVQHSDYLRMFDLLDKTFAKLIEPLCTLRDKDGWLM